MPIEVEQRKFSEIYQAFPKQLECHRILRDRRAVYLLFGGGAGPGKSKWLVMEASRQANLHPEVNTLVLRRTEPELEGSVLLEFRRTVPPRYYKSFVDSPGRHIVTWHNDSITKFGAAHHEKDIEQYYGAEWLFIGFDEAARFTRYQWQFMKSRNRCSVAGSFPCMAGATNPIGIGHKFLKDLFIDRDAPWDSEYDPREYAYVPALLRDNPVYANDEAYKKKLRSLPTHLRDALLNGDWSLLSGQYFDCWDEATLVCRPEDMGIKGWWPRWISIDWGFEHPSAVYWHTRDALDVFTYRELVQNRLTPRMLGEAIVERSVGEPDGGRAQPEKISAVFLSPDAFALRTGEATIAEQLGDVLSRGGIPRPSSAADDRVGGWMFLYELMRQPLDEREKQWKFRLHVGSNCEHLIESIPALVRDEKHVEDVAKMDWDGVNPGSGDDPADSERYGLYSMLRSRTAPLEERVKGRVAEYAKGRGVEVEEMEPQQVAMLSRRAEFMEREKKRKRGGGGRIWRPGR
jgi:hypothetical protein